MGCGHCASAVTKAVKAIPPVRDHHDLERGEVSVRGNPDEQAGREAIAGEGHAAQAA